MVLKKVIGIVGSPRRCGNTEILVDEVLKGAASKGAIIKKYILNELKIRGCQGCFKCQEEEICVQKDDMLDIYNEIKDAVGLVLGSPIYMNYVTAQTKLFIDRLLPFFKIGSGSRLSGSKKGVFVYSQGGGSNGPEIMSGLASLFSALGIEIIDIIGGNKLNELGAVKGREDLLKRAFQAGQRLIVY